MKLAKLVIALALLNLLALGQIINNKGTKEQDTFIQTVSGTPILMFDGIGTQTNQFEVIPTGAPATVSVVVIGCMRSGTCSSTLASTTSTANSLLAVSGGPYDYYQITASWTGGSSPTIKINRTGTAARSNSGGVAASVPFSGITSGINTQALMQVSNGANLQPLNFGNIINTETWMFPTDSFPSAAGPTWGGANTGGSLVSTNNYGVTVTLNSAVGETTPSGIAAFQLTAHVPACVTSACVITVTAPTLPIGFTGYTVYAQNITGAQSMQKIAGCVNISTNCTFGSIPTTTAPPATNALVPVPPNALASRCPPNVSPIWWLPDSNGNMNAQAYLSFFTDSVNGPPSPSGIFTECGQHFFTDQKIDPPGGKNAMIVMDHKTGVGTVQTNQDRVLWFGETNAAGDSSAHYSFTGIQGEIDVLGAPTWVSAVDAVVEPFSAQLSDQTTANVGNPNGGIKLFRASHTRQNTGGQLGSVTGFGIDFTNNSSTGLIGGTQWTGFNWGSASASGNTLGSVQQIGMNLSFRGTRGGTFNVGIYTPANASFTLTSTDYLIRNDFYNLPSIMGGPVYATQLLSSDFAPLQINSTVSLTGSLNVAQLSGVSVNNPSCTGGASTYSYKWVSVDTNGGQVASGSIGPPSTCTNPLTSGNPVTFSSIPNNFGPNLNQAVRYDLFRTGGPMGTGKIGCLGLTGSGCLWTCSHSSLVQGGTTCSTVADTGIVADGTTPPIANNTGGVNAYSFGTTTNCAAVGSAANPSVAACSAASAGSFSCATAASTGTCTVNTTAVTANSQIFIQQRSDTTTGTRLGVTCNTGVTTVIPDVTAVVAATSFTINIGTVAVNPECFSYFVVNQ